MKNLTHRSKLITAILVGMFSLIPVSVLAVMALRIQPADEQEAAFCLHLLDRAGSEISYLDGRAIQLLGERLANAPDASDPSGRGRVAAEIFLADSPHNGLLSSLLMECRASLAEITERYAWRSCGYGIGSLSQDWSERDWYQYDELLRGEQRDTGMISRP